MNVFTKRVSPSAEPPKKWSSEKRMCSYQWYRNSSDFFRTKYFSSYTLNANELRW